MWMISREGFFSAVAVNNSRVQVRARRQTDLKNLRKFDIRGRIIVTPDADYPFRVITSKTLWAAATAKMSRSINYDNFKNEVKLTDKDRAEIYTEVWRVLRDLEKPFLGKDCRMLLHLPKG